jgi:vacuolar iron transporter family protein
MFQHFMNRKKQSQTKFGFGMTSAIITNLGLITGLDKVAHPQMIIVGGILAVALADNISDSLAIHIYQEAECVNHREAWFSTATNFLSRLLVSLTFVFLVVVLPIRVVVPVSILWGLFLLAILSYSIAKSRKVNPYIATLEHLGIAILVIIASHAVSGWIHARFS